MWLDVTNISRRLWHSEQRECRATSVSAEQGLQRLSLQSPMAKSPIHQCMLGPVRPACIAQSTPPQSTLHHKHSRVRPLWCRQLRSARSCAHLYRHGQRAWLCNAYICNSSDQYRVQLIHSCFSLLHGIIVHGSSLESLCHSFRIHGALL